MAVTTPISPVSIVPRGAYSAGTEYYRLNVVTDSGNSYMYINATPSTGTALNVDTHWLRIAEKGDPTSSTASDIPTSTAGVSVQGALDTHTSQLAENADNAALWRTATGNPAPCYPVPGSRLYSRVELVSTQEGTGDPSPENVRPIVPALASGGVVKVRRTGKNFIDWEGLLTKFGTGVEVTKTVSGLKITLSGTPSANYRQVAVNNIPINPAILGKEMLCSVKIAGNEPWFILRQYDNSGTKVAEASMNSAGTTALTVSQNTAYLQIVLCLNRTTTGTAYTAEYSNVQLELGSVATPYEPYSGADYDLLTAAQDFYGLPDAPVVVDAEAGAIRNHTGYIASYDGETVPAGWVSSTGALTTGAQVVYPLAAPEIIPITPPAIAALERLKRTEARQNVLTATANDGTAGIQKHTVTYQKSPIRESDEIAAAIAALA